ncbi:uncharacterized protein LOC128207732 isoform X1 [Mya arenaria]|uniref:uncharacterized protein LOC128207732 isoform X1 n=1 Tax=Mya arenaria TaxID=6604 RepID=UPI0022E3A7D3|nr:uncharacterized protein LOC128207732 isoform X1 [Mya arenaria]
MVGKTKIQEIDLGKEDTTWDEIDEKKKSCLKQILRPILLAMAIAGCYNFSDLIYIQKSENDKTSVKWVLSLMYRLVLLLVTLAATARYACILFYLPSDYQYIAILCLVWALHLVTQLLLSFKTTSRKYGHYEKAFQHWESVIIPESRQLGLRCPVAQIRRQTITAVIIGMAIIILNVVSIGIQLEVSADPVFYLFPLSETHWSKMFYIFLMLMSSLVWIVPQANAIILSKTLTTVFTVYNETFEKQITDNKNNLPENFPRMRQLHINICKLVEELDNDMGWFYATDMGFMIFLTVFTLYQIVKTTMDTFSLVMYFFWFLSGIAIVVFTTSFAAFTHEAAHAPLDTIYYINVQDITVEKLAQLNLFLSKLTGTQVGFTTCGLLTITKEFILTIAGVFLTYFAVLYTL